MSTWHQRRVFGDILPEGISQEVFMNFVRNVCPEDTFSKLLPHLQGALN